MLADQHVPAVSLSFVGLTRRSGKIAERWSIKENYPDYQAVFLDSGAYTFNKPDSELTREQAKETAENYMVFVQDNIDSLTLVSEFDANILGRDTIIGYRRDFYDTLPPEKFMPIWHADESADRLEELASMYQVIGVTQLDMHDTSFSPIFNAVINRFGVNLHGVAITGRDMMKSVNWSSVSSTSWLSPAKFGDTIVWTGRELKWYPKDYKDRARKTHRNLFTDIGLSYEKIEADDSTELLKLSIWSWQQFVDSLVTTQGKNNISTSTESRNSEVEMLGSDNRNAELAPIVRIKRETTSLPVFGTTVKTEFNDDGDAEEVSYIHKRSDSNRACNTCFLRTKCPAFMPDANCAYGFPIEIKTRDQLKALQDGLIEMQAQRVAFMQFSEDLEGGYADPNLSSEIDRLQRMIKSKQDSERDRLSINIEATQVRQGPSLIQQVLGNDASMKLRALEKPQLADDLIKDSDIFDGELVDD